MVSVHCSGHCTSKIVYKIIDKLLRSLEKGSGPVHQTARWLLSPLGFGRCDKRAPTKVLRFAVVTFILVGLPPSPPRPLVCLVGVFVSFFFKSAMRTNTSYI